MFEDQVSGQIIRVMVDGVEVVFQSASKVLLDCIGKYMAERDKMKQEDRDKALIKGNPLEALIQGKISECGAISLPDNDAARLIETSQAQGITYVPFKTGDEMTTLVYNAGFANIINSISYALGLNAIKHERVRSDNSDRSGLYEKLAQQQKEADAAFRKSFISSQTETEGKTDETVSPSETTAEPTKEKADDAFSVFGISEEDPTKKIKNDENQQREERQDGEIKMDKTPLDQTPAEAKSQPNGEESVNANLTQAPAELDETQSLLGHQSSDKEKNLSTAELEENDTAFGQQQMKSRISKNDERFTDNMPIGVETPEMIANRKKKPFADIKSELEPLANAHNAAVRERKEEQMTRIVANAMQQKG